MIEETAARVERLEAELKKRTAELESVNQELTAFSYSVSHDLRAPLRFIDGFSEALAEEYGQKLDEQGRDYLQRLRGAVARMELMISSLLELARVSRADLNRQPVDLTAMARSIAEELKRSDPARKVDFLIHPDLTVEGDPALLKVAFEHLLRNSWKFTSKHPSATIEVGSEEHDGRRMFYVRDDGVGFDPSYAHKLFGAFQRLHSASEYEGLGIGLAMVQRIVRRHGGAVRAVGGVDEGATIYMALE